MNSTAPNRTLLRYFGGKWMIAPWIISHFPPHKNYVEPFGGGGSVLLRKPRSKGEVYNDINGDVVNLFKVVRDFGPELIRRLELTPLARDEYYAAYEISDEPIERARQMVVRAFMGVGSDSVRRRSGFRSSKGSNRLSSNEWANYPKSLERIIARLKGVLIENKDAKVLSQRISYLRRSFERP